MDYDDTYIGTVFIAPASYLIEELQEQEKEIFKNGVFQYDNLVCGIVDKIDSKRGYVWATQSSRQQLRRFRNNTSNRLQG